MDFPKSGQFRAENDRIAAIRSQTLRETAGLRQSGAKHFGKRQDCSNPAFPGQDEPGFPKSAHSPNTACPSPSPNETTRGPGLQESGAAPCTLPPSLRRSAHAGGRGEAQPKAQALPADGGKGISEAGFWRDVFSVPRPGKGGFPMPCRSALPSFPRGRGDFSQCTSGASCDASS